MNKFRILLGLAALFVLLTAPAYFDSVETDGTPGTLAGTADGSARGALATATGDARSAQR